MGERLGFRESLPVGIVAGVVFAVALVLFLLLLRSPGAAPDLAAGGVDVSGFEREVAERLRPVEIRPVSALRVRATRVDWRDAAGRTWLEAPTIVFSIDAAAVGGGAILIRDGRVVRPVVRLAQGPGGVWNYESVLDPLLNGADRPRRAGGGTRFALRNLAVEGGQVIIDRPDLRLAATSLDLRLSRAELAGPGVVDPVFVIARADAVLDLPGLGDDRVTRTAAVEQATIRLAGGAVAFEIASGAFGESRLADARGVWNPALGGLGLDAVLTADPVRLADLPWLRTEIPPDAVGAFRVRIEPLPGDRTALAFSGISVTGGGSAASGAVRVVFGEAGFTVESADLRLDPLALELVEAFTGPLPYSGTVTGRIRGSGGALTFDVRARLATPTIDPFDTDLTGEVAFTPAGVDLRRVTTTLDRVPLAALRQIAPGLPLAGPVTGTVTLRGMPSEVPITIDVRLEAGGGIVTLAGTVDLRGRIPAYDLTGRLAGVELRQVLAPAAPPLQLHTTFRLTGSGTDLATANATVRADGTFTGWHAEPGDTLSILARVAGGELTADRVLLAVGPIDATADGSWRFVGGGGGSIRYAATIESLEPLAPYLPGDPEGRRRFARGSLDAQGTLAGTLDRPALQGSVRAVDFRYGEWAASRFAGTYDFISAGGLPRIEAEVVAEDLRTPAGAFERAELSLDFTRPTFELSLAADRVDGGIIQIGASGLIEEAGGREVLLSHAEIDLQDQRWRLPEPARITWMRGDAVLVEDLQFEQVDGEGLLRLSGVVAPADQADFALEVRSLPMGELIALTGIDLDLSGDVTADASFRGPADRPAFRADVVFAEGAFRGIAFRDVRLDVAYADTELVVEGAGQLGDSATVDLRGRIPVALELGLVPRFELIGDAPVEATLVTEDFPLATLDPGFPTVRDLVGLVNASIRVAGTPDVPVLSGSARLAGGALTVSMLNQRYDEISGTATFEGRRMLLRDLTARSDGTVTATGTLTFDDLANPTLDVRAALDGFRPQGVSNQRDAAAWGTLSLTGTAREPILTGSTRLDDGTLEVTAFQGPSFEDQFNRPAEFELVRAQDIDLAGDVPIGLIVSNLRVQAGGDLWFATEEARAQLSGNLIVNRHDGDLTIQGDLAGDRGTFNLRMGPVTRRFEIVQASIQFYGDPDPNPGLDIVASRLVRTARSGDLEVRARISGTVNNPSLGLTTGEGATIPESEILSFLLFGRSEATLGTAAGRNTLLSLEDALAFYGFFDLATEEVLRALPIGVDYFQIQMRSGGGIEGSNLFVVVGHEVIDDVFLSFETPLDRNAIWAFTGEWRIDREWTLEAALEPVHYRAGTTVPVPYTFGDRDARQFFIAIRRRWTY